MNKTTKIILALLIAIIIGLVGYSIAIQDKVKAGNDLIQAQARVDELKDLIEDAKLEYAKAEQDKLECINTYERKRDKAHEDAERYRTEINELQKGFMLNR